MRSFAPLRMTANLSSREKRGISLDMIRWQAMIPSIASETDYDAALKVIADFFEKEPKPGSPEAYKFNLLAAMIADYEIKHWPINKAPQDPSSS